MATTTVGILVGGGPAPGINGVISAVTFHCTRRRGYNVYGFLGGFKHLVKPSVEDVKYSALSMEQCNRAFYMGGTIIQTSRVNPTRKEEDMNNVLKNLKELGVRYLVTIGGDDTAHSSRSVAAAAKKAGIDLGVVHVPKTIDNDLMLPNNHPTFGYTTAVEIGAEICRNLMEDARSTVRWFLVEAMGRKSGSLALGMSQAAGCHLCLIPEQWQERDVTMDDICCCIESSLYKRLLLGKENGVIVIAEGLAERMPEKEVEKLYTGDIPRDPHGHIRLEKANLADAIVREMEKRLKAKGQPVFGLTAKKVGYELRSQNPVAFDIEYTNQLGYGAMALLEQGLSGYMATRGPDGIIALELDQLKDPKTGKIMVRTVDIFGMKYQVASRYMTHLEEEDLSNPEMLQALANAAKMSVKDFVAQFKGVPSLFPRRAINVCK